MTWRWLALAALVLVCGLALLRSFVATSSTAAIRLQPAVMVSGLDDHGLVATTMVALSSRPDLSAAPSAVVAQLPHGTMVHVLEQRGEWLRVQPVVAPGQAGWINDYYLRGQVLRVDTGEQVQLVSARFDRGQVLVAVRPMSGEGPITWVAAARLREVGAREADGHQHVHRLSGLQP